jgi:hypothetical protein
VPNFRLEYEFCVIDTWSFRHTLQTNKDDAKSSKGYTVIINLINTLTIPIIMYHMFAILAVTNGKFYDMVPLAIYVETNGGML